MQADREFGEQASLRLGLRYEATNYSVDYLRFDPTVNLQYRLFDDTIVSVGSRVRFRDFRDHVRLIRNDGSTYQKQLSISSPSFPDPFQGGRAIIDERRTSLYRLDPDAAARRPAGDGGPDAAVLPQRRQHLSDRIDGEVGGPTLQGPARAAPQSAGGGDRPVGEPELQLPLRRGRRRLQQSVSSRLGARKAGSTGCSRSSVSGSRAMPD